MNSFIYPIKNDMLLSELLVYLSNQSPEYHLAAVIMLSTGANVKEILQIERNQVKDGLYYSPCMRLSCNLLLEAENSFKKQFEKTGNSLYLFPGKMQSPRSVDSFNRKFNMCLRSFQEGFCIMSLRKTFAYHYLQEHGNLNIPTFKEICYRKEYICKYLDISLEEFSAIISGGSKIPDDVDILYDTIKQGLLEAKNMLSKDIDEKSALYLKILYRYTLSYLKK